MVDNIPVEGPTPIVVGSVISLGGCELFYRVVPPGEDTEHLKGATLPIAPRMSGTSSTRQTGVYELELIRVLRAPPPDDTQE